MSLKKVKEEDQQRLVSPIRKKLVNYWLPPLIWAIVIFLFSSYPTGEVSEIHWKDFVVKKTAHIVEYAVLTALVYRAFGGMGVGRRKAAIYSVIISVLYGFSDEIHQSFTPGREPRIRDVLFDTIGATFSIYFLWRLLPPNRKSKKIFSLIYKFIYGEKEGEETEIE